MDRRDFLRRSGVVVAGLALAPVKSVEALAAPPVPVETAARATLTPVATPGLWMVQGQSPGSFGNLIRVELAGIARDLTAEISRRTYVFVPQSFVEHCPLGAIVDIDSGGPIRALRTLPNEIGLGHVLPLHVQ